ncbi:MAG: hypothetical protein F4Y14_07635 [Acidobacteria bacterium]|nr:hypothetical protein [Acidobacteriota bacterium]
MKGLILSGGEGTRLRPSPASTYALDGKQYIAVAMGPALWAFALDGEVPARGEPSPDPPVDDQPAGPAPRETDEIETATLLEIPHTPAARDGSWSTGTLNPGLWGFVTFDEPGTFLYHCEDHPWMVGEITVDP